MGDPFFHSFFTDKSSSVDPKGLTNLDMRLDSGAHGIWAPMPDHPPRRDRLYPQPDHGNWRAGSGGPVRDALPLPGSFCQDHLRIGRRFLLIQIVGIDNAFRFFEFVHILGKYHADHQLVIVLTVEAPDTKRRNLPVQLFCLPGFGQSLATP